MMVKSRVMVAGMTAIALAYTTGALGAQQVAREGHPFGLDAAVPIFPLLAAGKSPYQIDSSRLSGEPDLVSRSLAFRLQTMPPTQERGNSIRILKSTGIGLAAGFALGWVLGACAAGTSMRV